jgi:hypothetical protein
MAFFVSSAANLRDHIENLLISYFDDKAEIRWHDGKLYIKVKLDAGFKDIEKHLTQEEIDEDVCGGGIRQGLDGKTFRVDVTELQDFPWCSICGKSSHQMTVEEALKECEKWRLTDKEVEDLMK